MIELYIAIFISLVIILPLVFLYLPDDFKLTGMGIFYSILMLLLLFFNFMLDMTTYSLKGSINERVQDYTEKSAGIKKLILGLDSHPNTDNPYGYLFYSAFKDTRCYSFNVSREIKDAGAIYVRTDGPPDVIPTEEKIVYWNENTYFCGSSSFIKWNISNKYVEIFYIFAGVGGILFFLWVHFFVKSHLRKKEIWNKTYTIPLLLSTLLIPCIMTVCLWQIPWISEKSIFNPVVKRIVKWESSQHEMEEILKKTPEVSLVSSPFFLKIFCLPNVFVSKKPFFPHNYVRINLDIFNYIFYAPEVINPKEINPLMEYIKLTDGTWLGSYSEYNALKKQSMIIPLSSIALIWLMFIVLIIVCHRSIGTNDRLCAVNGTCKEKTALPENSGRKSGLQK